MCDCATVLFKCKGIEGHFLVIQHGMIRLLCALIIPVVLMSMLCCCFSGNPNWQAFFMTVDDHVKIVLGLFGRFLDLSRQSIEDPSQKFPESYLVTYDFE